MWPQLLTSPGLSEDLADLTRTETDSAGLDGDALPHAEPVAARLDVLRRRDTGIASAGPPVGDVEVHDANLHPLLRQLGYLRGELRLDGLAVE